MWLIFKLGIPVDMDSRYSFKHGDLHEMDMKAINKGSVTYTQIVSDQESRKYLKDKVTTVH